MGVSSKTYLNKHVINSPECFTKNAPKLTEADNGKTLINKTIIDFSKKLILQDIADKIH